MPEENRRDLPEVVISPMIPEDYDEIELGGKTYYQVEETLYKPTILNGKLLFEVACSL